MLSSPCHLLTCLHICLCSYMYLLDLEGRINDVRNGLLLFKPVEWAFDTSQLCFKLDQQFEHYVPHLLNERLSEVKLVDKLWHLCSEVKADRPTMIEFHCVHVIVCRGGNDKAGALLSCTSKLVRLLTDQLCPASSFMEHDSHQPEHLPVSCR